MKVFLSHTHQDRFLAKKISSALEENGFEVWDAETEILPGDNLAEKVSDALKESEAMVVLITPESLTSKWVQHEIDYALGNKSYSNWLIPVLVGFEENISEENIPWILQRLSPIRLSKSVLADKEINQISELAKIISHLIFDKFKAEQPKMLVSLDDENNFIELSDSGAGVTQMNRELDERYFLSKKILVYLNGLTEYEQQIFRLRFIEGCKPRVIAEILNQSYEQTLIDCNRVMAKFRGWIKKNMRKLD